MVLKSVADTFLWALLWMSPFYRQCQPNPTKLDLFKVSPATKILAIQILQQAVHKGDCGIP